MVNHLVTDNSTVEDLQLRLAVVQICTAAGPHVLADLLIELGCARMVRTEIDSLLQRYRLILGAVEGSA